jgi:hypothetical protein
VITVRDRAEDLTASFTDETSPNLPKSHRKVSIHGQVIRESDDLKWFRELIKLYPNDSSETKSVRILQDFQRYPYDFRNRVWAGLKKVRIHIVDSLSYQDNYEEVLRSVFKRDEVRQLLDRDARRGNEFAQSIRQKLDEFVASDILRDSTSQRLRDMVESDGALGGFSVLLRPLNPQPRYRPVDLEPFRKKSSSMTGQAVKAVAKAASVFTRVMDRLTPMAYLDSSWRRIEVHNGLRESHAFDEGDEKALQWVRDERKEIGKTTYFGLPEYVDDFPYETYSEFAYGQLYKLRSHESEYVQAADIASGFAKDAYEKHGVVAVAEKFEYVTINGERITQDNAQRKFERWGELHERAKRDHQLVIVSL